MDTETAKIFREFRKMGVGGDTLEKGYLHNATLMERQKEFLINLPNARVFNLHDWCGIPEFWALQDKDKVSSEERYQTLQEKIEDKKGNWCDKWISLYDVYREFSKNVLSIGWLSAVIAKNPLIYIVPFDDNTEIYKFRNSFGRASVTKNNSSSHIYIAESQLYRIIGEKKEFFVDDEIKRRIIMMQGYYSIGEISFNLNVSVDTVFTTIWNSDSAD